MKMKIILLFFCFLLVSSDFLGINLKNFGGGISRGFQNFVGGGIPDDPVGLGNAVEKLRSIAANMKDMKLDIKVDVEDINFHHQLKDVSLYHHIPSFDRLVNQLIEVIEMREDAKNYFESLMRRLDRKWEKAFLPTMEEFLVGTKAFVTTQRESLESTILEVSKSLDLVSSEFLVFNENFSRMNSILFQTQESFFQKYSETLILGFCCLIAIILLPIYLIDPKLEKSFSYVLIGFVLILLAFMVMISKDFFQVIFVLAIPPVLYLLFKIVCLKPIPSFVLGIISIFVLFYAVFYVRKPSSHMSHDSNVKYIFGNKKCYPLLENDVETPVTPLTDDIKVYQWREEHIHLSKKTIESIANDQSVTYVFVVKKEGVHDMVILLEKPTLLPLWIGTLGSHNTQIMDCMNNRKDIKLISEGYFQLFSSLIRVEPGKPGVSFSISGKFKKTGKEVSVLYAGGSCYYSDDYSDNIPPDDIYRIGGAPVLISEFVDDVDNPYFEIDERDHPKLNGWMDEDSTNELRSLTIFLGGVDRGRKPDIKIAGYNYPKDGKLVKNNEKDGGAFKKVEDGKVYLTKHGFDVVKSRGGIIPGQSTVCNTASFSYYKYCAGAYVHIKGDKFQTYKGNMTGEVYVYDDSVPEYHRFSPGTKYISGMLLMNYNNTVESVLEMKNLQLGVKGM